MKKCKNLFTDEILKNGLAEDSFKKYIKLKLENKPIDLTLANEIASVMKMWAVENGATHYTHWFQPLTNKTAGKQVSFFENSDGVIIEKFEGKHLLKGETDASSFPSGGERLTFEARGYTVWDYNSNCVIEQKKNGNKILLIPTAFCSYNGIALDEKTPLLRATQSLSENATSILNMLGYDDVKRVNVFVGGEQEYFVIDQKYFFNRPDLVLTGRTLFGAKPVKSQEKNRSYFGSITDKMSEFMDNVNSKLWDMGIFAKLQHNEVAPCQYEIVPMYAPVNISCDQNQLIMEILEREAKKMGLEVLLNEKPFAKINGSGKHTNWSVGTDTGINLLDVNIADKSLFLLFFTAIISAVDDYAGLVKLSATYYGNQKRLGGDEAPPTIISMFIGDNILNWLNGLKIDGKMEEEQADECLDLKVNYLPKQFKDNCDRNRTSPFAYTGNKFEFRMVGSSQSLAFPNTILCSILSYKLGEIKNILLNSNNIKQDVLSIIISNFNEHKRIIFNGNGYDLKWHKQAEELGLPKFESVADCYKILDNKKIIEMFNSQNILNKAEIKLRQNIMYENYIECAECEAKCVKKMLGESILPNLQYFYDDIINQTGITNYTTKMSSMLKSKIENMTEMLNLLEKDLAKLSEISTYYEKCLFCEKNLEEDMNKIREIYDAFEEYLPKNYLPYPTYDSILYFN